MIPIKAIHTQTQHKQALDAIDALWNASQGSLDAERLEVLAILVEAYEAQHHPILPPDPVEAIKFRMEQQGLDRKDLEAVLGASRGRVSEILNRRRSLSLSMIRKLVESWSIPAEILIQPTAQS